MKFLYSLKFSLFVVLIGFALMAFATIIERGTIVIQNIEKIGVQAGAKVFVAICMMFLYIGFSIKSK